MMLFSIITKISQGHFLDYFWIINFRIEILMSITNFMILKLYKFWKCILKSTGSIWFIPLCQLRHWSSNIEIAISWFMKHVLFTYIYFVLWKGRNTNSFWYFVQILLLLLEINISISFYGISDWFITFYDHFVFLFFQLIDLFIQV